MKFIKKTASIVSSLIIILALGGYIFVRNFDLNKYKPYIQNLVEKEIGRQLVMTGDAKIGISLVPTIVINDVALSNPEWAQNPYMAQFEKLEIEFKIVPLLHKKIEINELVLVKPQIFLETSVDGLNNWEFDMSKTSVKVPNTNNIAGGKPEIKNAAAMLGIGLVAENVAVEEGIVNYFDARSQKNVNVVVNSITMNVPNEKAPVILNVDAIYDMKNVNAKFKAESIDSLLTEGKVNFELAAEALNVDAVLKGSVENIFGDMSFKANGNVYNPAGNMDIPEISTLFEVEGNLKNANIVFGSLNVATNDMTGTVWVDWSANKPLIKADLNSSVFDVNSFSKSSVVSFKMPSLISEAKALTMVPSTKIPFDYLNMVDADVNLRIGKLILADGVTLNNVSVKAILQNGNLNADKLQFFVGDGKLDGNVKVGASDKSIKIGLVSKNLKIQDLIKTLALKSNAVQILSGGNLDIDMNVATYGDTYRKLSENLAGQAIIIVDKSEIKTVKLDWITNSILGQVLSMLGVRTQNIDKLDVICSVVRADFKNGKADFPKGIVLNAEEIKLVGNGNINLVNDKIDFTVAPMLNKLAEGNVTQALVSFMKIDGSLNNPKLSLDKSSALTTIIGSVATGGVYLGSEIVLSEDDNPCYNSLIGTKFENRFPKPKGVKTTTKDAYQDASASTKEAVKDLGNAAKDLLNAFIK